MDILPEKKIVPYTSNIYLKIREATSITEELSCRGLFLQPAGRFRKKRICPFPSHPDTSPSFYVNEYEGYEHFKCFGCGSTGDVIDFVQKYEGWSLRKTIRYFADKYSIAISKDIDVEKEIYEAKREKKIHCVHILSTELSCKICEILKKNNNQAQTFKEISPYLLKIDRSVYEEDEPSFGAYRSFLREKLSDIKKNNKEMNVFEKEECKNCSSYNMWGNPNSKILIISGKCDFDFEHDCEESQFAIKSLLAKCGVFPDKFFFFKSKFEEKCSGDCLRRLASNMCPEKIILLGEHTKNTFLPKVSSLLIDRVFGKMLKANILGIESDVVFSYSECLLQKEGKNSVLTKKFLKSIIASIGE